ncbi:MAG: DNA recombination protein RmuC [Steroidobacteraceae bacterium]
MSLVAWCVLAAVVGAVIAGLIVQIRAARQIAEARSAGSVAEARVEDLRQQLAAQKLWVAEQSANFERSVLASAAKLMEERGRALNEASRAQVESVVGPFREQLQDFRRRVDEIHSVEAQARGRLDERIVQLTSLNQAVSVQAERLTHALTVASKSTGDWGETILQKILEDSGLRLDREYRLQHSVRGAEGERLQPDAVIFLPEGRQLIIDAKVSNKAWTAYCNEREEGARAALLRDHLASLRAHMKGLASRDYPGSPDLATVDFVLMFVPVEAALLTALASDEGLYADAYRQRIILVSPSTLMAVVKLVEGLWTFQRRQESADEIAEAGRKLYEKLVGFATTFLEVGASLQKSNAAYDKAMGQLSTGRGSAVALAEKMVELGVTPSAGKQLPDSLTRDAQGEA